MRVAHPCRPSRHPSRACRGRRPPRPSSSPSGLARGTSRAGAQAGQRVCACARAPAVLCLHTHEPMQVVAAVGAAIRPAAVQRPEHPLLMAGKHPHPHLAVPLPIPAWALPTGLPPCNALWPNRPKELVKFCLYDTAIRRRLKVAGYEGLVHDVVTLPLLWSRVLLDPKPIFQALPLLLRASQHPRSKFG
jgi:hypothetical protein